MTDIKYSILELFPKPIYLSSINENLNKKQLDFIEKTKSKCNKNDGNFSSIDSYVLNLPIFKNLKKQITVHVNNFCKNIYSYKNIDPFITQSWLNYTGENEFHHLHSHQNSFLSGVFYISANESDSIVFNLHEYKLIDPSVSNYNKYNSNSWFYPIKPMELILFKSSLEHKVDTKKEKNTRISLAFNVWIKGHLGVKKDLTELKI
jgi:uncharacterized protein (TIGR02466 family)